MLLARPLGPTRPPAARRQVEVQPGDDLGPSGQRALTLTIRDARRAWARKGSMGMGTG